MSTRNKSEKARRKLWEDNGRIQTRAEVRCTVRNADSGRAKSVRAVRRKLDLKS